MASLFVLLGAVGGFVSGLLGVGGAVIMIPLMLYVPPLFGFPRLSMQRVAGLSVVQVLVASAAGLLIHRKNRLFDRRSFVLIGGTMALGALCGAYLSRFISEGILLAAFGALVTAAAAMLLLRPPFEMCGSAEPNAVASLGVGAAVGTLSGMAGAGGGFILIPLMIYILKIPTRTAIGTSLGIVFLGSISGVLGRLLSGRIDWGLALALSLGAVPLAQAGAALSKRLSAEVLRSCLFVIVAATGLQTWLRIFTAG